MEGYQGSPDIGTLYPPSTVSERKGLMAEEARESWAGEDLYSSRREEEADTAVEAELC